MKAFNDQDFLLMNAYGKKLYHNVAATLPVIDPHNHIDPAAIASNLKYENIYQLWVQQDPYKHRAMRICGIPEALITGNKPDKEKFFAWASCFPQTAGNPLFHWSCMELKYLLGTDELLSPDTAEKIWCEANEALVKKEFSTIQWLKKLGVEMLCTSDDLTDSLEHHFDFARQQNEIICLPSLRSDSMVGFHQPAFREWLMKLGKLTLIDIVDLNTYQNAIIHRLNFFDKSGCLLSDHSLDSGFTYTSTTFAKAAELFNQFLNGAVLSEAAMVNLHSYLLQFLGKEYAKRKWKMQLHIGAYRYTSSVLRNKAGAAGGYACIGHTAHIPSLCNFLDDLDKEHCLPKTILYTLNPADNAAFASITGSYAEDNVRAKIQFGPAWWYNDHYEGVVQQLKTLSSYGLLSTSIGMTTDSRSILSFIRHDYFRRILCNLFGEWIEEGKLPDDWEMMSNMVKNIAYYNIKNWIKNE